MNEMNPEPSSEHTREPSKAEAPRAIERSVLFDISRQALTMEGAFRFWELGRTRYRPQWFRSTSPDFFCDAEYFYREAVQTRPACSLRLSTAVPYNGTRRELVLTLDRVSLYGATYQLRLAELDGEVLHISN